MLSQNKLLIFSGMIVDSGLFMEFVNSKNITTAAPCLRDDISNIISPIHHPLMYTASLWITNPDVIIRHLSLHPSPCLMYCLEYVESCSLPPYWKCHVCCVLLGLSVDSDLQTELSSSYPDQ